jgi:PAS domain S-box-containing protein
MNDQRKTKAQLIAELASLRQDFAVVQKREEQLRVAKEIEPHHAEETRPESEDRWRLALSGSNTGVWDWNLKTNEVFFSGRWKTMLGFSEDEIGTTFNEWSDRVHPEDLPRVMQAVEEHLARKTEFYETEHRMRCKDGSYKWIQDRGQALWGAEGNVVRMVGSHIDITARKQTETSLREQQDLFRTIMDNGPAVAYLKDETGRYTYMNKPLAEYLHRVTGDTHWEEKTDVDVWPDQAEQRRAHDRAVLASNRAITVEETTTYRDSVTHWLSLKFPLYLPSGQRLLAGMSVDITALKRTEAWLEGLIATTQDAVISIDREARVVRFNPAAEKIFGYSKDEVVGQKVNVLMGEPYASEHDGYIARYEHTHVPHAIGRIRAVTARRKNGQLFPIELSVTEIVLDAETHYAAFIRDISERVRLQERLVERERLAAIGTTAAKLAHEIGNPLNGMYARIQLLERRLLRQSSGVDEKVTADMRSIAEEVQRLSQLLQEFRALARRQQYNLQPTNIAVIAAAVLDAETEHCRRTGIRVETQFSPDLPQVMVDSGKFTQALVNLCKNACEAMPRGGTLTVKGTNSGGQVTLEVCDTGVGIPEGVDIFEPFITTKPEGTGLGLPIARQIIAGHGGSLNYVSELEKGTTFIISLPVKSPVD